MNIEYVQNILFTFKINCIQFFNALLNSATDPTLKKQLQREFINLGVVEKLKAIHDSEISEQSGLFEEQLSSDINDHFNLNDPTEIIKVIQTSVGKALPKLISILNLLLSISNAENTYAFL